jgi:Fusaric acid resistance protein-like
VAGEAHALSVRRSPRRWFDEAGSTPLLPTWSPAAAIRAIRATIVIPGVFALTDVVIGNLQMAIFAAFGGFSTLVLTTFSGTRRDKLTAHLGLALTGTLLVAIGTVVSRSTVVAAIATVPVAFAVFFAGVGGPNAAAGVTGALLAYVLPAASVGTVSMIPDRLAGWWLASITGTLAVLALSPPSPANRLHASATKLASALADEIDAILSGSATEATLAACVDARNDLLASFNATPYRPTGLAATDQALANAVELFEWCTSLLVDSAAERGDLRDAAAADRELLATAAAVLRDSGGLLAGDLDARPDLDRLDRSRRASIARLRELSPDGADFREQAMVSFHACAIAVTVLMIGADALLAGRRVDAQWVADARARWFGGQSPGLGNERRLTGIQKYAGVAVRHASLRSAWFVNSLRGALALAAAVLVADLTAVQHGFWVVFGTLSVLRTTAGATGSTALRALTGTALGFVIGGALLVAIGTGTGALWVALPIAVFIAAYSPGTVPFAIGQAAFTVTIAVLFNLLVPVGWKVGVVRVEDVAIGCAVSIAVGSLFWPRGTATVVGDDLAAAFRSGATYLTQAVEWVCGLRAQPPDRARRAVDDGLRLDEALRGLLTEQGTKHMPKEELWRLVGGTLRLRVTAHAIAGLPRSHGHELARAQAALKDRAEKLDDWFEQLAAQVGRPRGRPVAVLTPPTFDADIEASANSRQTIWLGEHVDHLTDHLSELVEPAAHLAQVRRRPWWR